MVVADRTALAASPVSMKYRNERWGFCIAYPRNWLPYEGVNRAGVLLRLGGDTTISIGALPNMEAEADSSRQATLEENAASDLRSIGIGLSPPPNNIRIVSKTKTMLWGMQVLRTEVTYTQKEAARTEETIYLIKDKALYTFELKCPSRRRIRYEATFRLIVESFQLECDRQER